MADITNYKTLQAYVDATLAEDGRSKKKSTPMARSTPSSPSTPMAGSSPSTPATPMARKTRSTPSKPRKKKQTSQKGPR